MGIGWIFSISLFSNFSFFFKQSMIEYGRRKLYSYICLRNGSVYYKQQRGRRIGEGRSFRGSSYCHVKSFSWGMVSLILKIGLKKNPSTQQPQRPVVQSAQGQRLWEVRSLRTGGELAGGFATASMTGSNTITWCAHSVWLCVLLALLWASNTADSRGGFVATWFTAPYGVTRATIVAQLKTERLQQLLGNSQGWGADINHPIKRGQEGPRQWLETHRGCWQVSWQHGWRTRPH